MRNLLAGIAIGIALTLGGVFLVPWPQMLTAFAPPPTPHPDAPLASATPEPLAIATADQLRLLVLANDFDGVRAALQAAVQADAASGSEPDLQRGLFNVFAETHPAIAAFTEKWLAKSPDDPLAMTARGWQLFALGWAMRGEDTINNVYPAALAAMRQRHGAASGLFQAAVAAAPDLIAASDGVLRLTMTLGNTDAIPVEMERIMALQPNRGSLIRAMLALAPQWGGSDVQVTLLCDRYAARITSVPGYDSQTCKIDAAYFANFRDGDRRETAHELLILNTNPILNYARLTDAVAGFGTPEWRLGYFRKVMAERPLTPAEGSAYDSTAAEVKGPAALVDTVEHDKALAHYLDTARLYADRDPLNPDEVLRYIAMLDETADGAAYDRADVVARLQGLLRAMPYSGKAWLRLAIEVAGQGAVSGTGTVADIDRAGPYFTNAVVYSNYALDVVETMTRFKILAILDPNDPQKARDISQLSAADLAQLDRAVHCPLIMDIKRDLIVCQNNGKAATTCEAGHLTPDGPVMSRIWQAFSARAACKAELTGNPPLQLEPVKIDF